MKKEPPKLQNTTLSNEVLKIKNYSSQFQQQFRIMANKTQVITPQVYLGFRQTSIMEFCCENYQQSLAAICFHGKGPS